PATTVWNGLPLQADEPAPAVVAALAARLGLAGRRVIFYGGRPDRLKGGLELVRALAVVRRAVPEAVVLTVGEALPGFADEMAALAANLGIADGLVAAGWLTGPELAAAYRLADVVATPSLCFESFGLLNLEAMLARKPVVASMWGGPSDVVEDGVTGYLVNPLQVGALAEGLMRRGGRVMLVVTPTPHRGARLAGSEPRGLPPRDVALVAAQLMSLGAEVREI